MGRNKEQKRDFIRKYKQDKCCAFCGWNEHPEILQFHHYQAVKECDISDLLRNDSRMELLKAEIKKCMLLCPNCHHWHHYNRPTNKPKPIIDLHIYNRDWEHIFN